MTMSGYSESYRPDNPRQDEQGSRDYEIVKQRFKLSKIFEDFEILLSTEPDPKKIKTYIEELNTAEIPDFITHKLQEITDKYQILKDEHAKNVQTIKEHFPTSSNEELGHAIFTTYIGTSPKGDVICIIDGPEPYILFEFTNPDDYVLFLQGAVTSAPGGNFHRSWSLEIPSTQQEHPPQKIHAKVICINTNKEQTTPERKRGFVHERQHFINDTIDFQAIEQNDAENHEHSWASKLLKDEFFAFSRDGRTPQEIRTILGGGPVYSWIFEALPEQAQKKLHEQLNDIIDACNKVDFKTYELHPSRFIGMLYDIPFSHLAESINNIVVYQKKTRRKMTEKIQQHTNDRRKKESGISAQWYINQYEDGKFNGKDV
ncbi:MAG: hypothetical protein CO029_02130 [Candidatus Magasanikbacteria bacterium CG_4_9_14_0_2_um_filter_41_10]|nr:MAG: hypothetical protein AUJ37_02685 [Candidatus Magasanikbacteria bacterium CG1_02_41_34]PJC53553.1 MAG: hypothetical protein CO029_02130 [Candidatus Magasanikbacteria bacterium CG_4_9_14_0_2_um_filter_41_10]